MNRLAHLLLAALLLGGAANAAQTGPQFNVIDLGPVRSLADCTVSLDETGRVASTTSAYQAFGWTAGTVEPLANLEPTGRSGACDVNDAGTVVGHSFVGVRTHAVVWQRGRLIDLGTFGGVSSAAYGINEKGQVVGDYKLGGGGSDEHAFRLGPDGFVDLGTLGGTHSSAYDINEDGWVVGYSRLASGGASHAVLWIDGNIQNLGTLGASNLDSFAYAISNAGVVVGQSSIFASNDRRAFRWSNGVMSELLNPPGSTFTIAYGINDVGLIVGTGDNRALLWQGDGVFDLNTLINPTLGWVLNGATDVDEQRRIGGYGLFGGVVHGFVLEPI